MKKFHYVLLMMIAMLLFAGSAMASEINLMPAEQISYILPRGMKANENVRIAIEDGKLDILIKDDNVQWADAFASTGMNGSNVQLIWQIQAPAGVTAGNYVIELHDDHFAEAEQLPSSFQMIGGVDGWGVPCKPDDIGLPPSERGMPITENGEVVATSIPELSYVVPVAKQKTVYVGWYDADRKLLDAYGYQKLTVTILHEREKAFQTTISNGAAAENIEGNTGDAAGVKVLEKKAGMISYVVPQADVPIQTRVRPTVANAVKYATLGNMKSGDLMDLRDLENGCAVITSARSSEMDAQSYTTTLFFCDANGKILETVSVSVSMQTEEEMLPWPAYVDMGIFPVAQDQLVIDNQAAKAGYTMDYDESTGHLSCSFNGEKKTGGIPGAVTLSIKDPGWGAIGYRVYEVSSNSLYGANGGSMAGLQYVLDAGYPNGPETVAADTVYRERYSAFNIIKPSDASITIYVPSVADVDHIAKLFVVEWVYDDGSVEYQYFWQTTDPFTAVEKSLPVESEKELKKPVEAACFVMGNNKKYEGWHLLVTCYTTQSDDNWHVDLSLEDEDGNPVHKVTKPIRLYLPYPEGHAYGDKGIVYKIKHYTNGLYSGKDGNSFETLEALATEYGLMFETDSFSPFVLGWEDAKENAAVEQSSEQPPKTGDHTPLGLWMIMAAGALFFLLALGKRKMA